jgi:hypothetical protein
MESAPEIVGSLSADRAQSDRAKSRSRSRVGGNRSTLLPTTDGRSLWARIMRDTYSALINVHLADMASETQRLVARRISTLEAELIFLEDRFAAIRAAGGEPDAATLDLYGRLADRQRRLADPLGWSRTPRVTPSLSDLILADHRAQQERENRPESAEPAT